MRFIQNPVNEVVWNVIEYEVRWPEDRKQREKHKFNLMGSKMIFVRTKEEFKDFYPNINMNTLQINGSVLKLKLKLKVEKACVMENIEQYRMASNCMFSSV